MKLGLVDETEIHGSRPRQRKYQPSLQEPKEKAEEEERGRRKLALWSKKLKTRVINSNCNPVWNEQLTLSIKDLDDPIRLRIRPGRTNCLAEESSINWNNGKVKQDMILRLKNGERGEMEIMLEWTDGPGYKDLMIQEDTMDATKRLD
ncbi:protein C2-DOMAIN ABA-RELATED 9-like [Brassica napus]|uniref:protein C2-DOMAIN ABA-RELATED 9-like n=1 Tax=Brassica napus TaxID=3708 RepID=UPI0020791584|nr:protein C2-DOMAIN ABA-RELATED 9-like [Brassica napus]